MSLAAVSIASMAAAAVGSLVSGVSQAGQANRAAGIANQNADIAEQQGTAEANLVRERAARLAGANRTNAGASGVDISGFNDAMADSDISSELDAQTSIWNSKMQANNLRAQGKADRSSGTSALVGAGIGAGTQALAGYGNWKYLSARDPAVLSPGSGGAGMARFGGIF